ncbi:MAG TPA: class I SAM-dependent methyltransferase [Verrucomicrobiales bacterium]|nr:class I SAM-dependent methyltransferase [Verrucomicrobiales bacterium]
MLRAVAYSHQLLQERLAPGDMAIDATAGNGQDTLFLTRLTRPGGVVFAFDVQETAIDATRRLLEREGVSPDGFQLFHAGHETLREMIPARWHGLIGAVIFNLGYLPGSDKTVTTSAANTVAAMKASLTMLRPGGVLVMVVYTGHPGGTEEAEAVLEFAKDLTGDGFHAVEYRTLNARSSPPFVIAMEKQR